MVKARGTGDVGGGGPQVLRPHAAVSAALGVGYRQRAASLQTTVAVGGCCAHVFFLSVEVTVDAMADEVACRGMVGAMAIGCVSVRIPFQWGGTLTHLRPRDRSA